MSIRPIRLDSWQSAGKGGNLEKLRELQKRRFADPEAVEKVVALDEAWRNGSARFHSSLISPAVIVKDHCANQMQCIIDVEPCARRSLVLVQLCTRLRASKGSSMPTTRKSASCERYILCH